MAIKAIFWVTLLALATAAGWHYRRAEWVQGWIHPRSAKPPAIKFDNGSVRDADASSQPTAMASQATPLGGIRKCRKGGQVVYTDGTCPPGAQEQPLRNGTVTIISGQAGTKSANAGEPAPQRATLRDVLDPPEEVSLKDKRMQKIVDQ